MTTSSYHPGAKFSIPYLHDMGGDLSGDEVDTIADAIVGRFDELAREAGDPTISWIPQLSEVYYECDGDSPNPMMPVHELTRDLEDMRQQASEEVWAAVCDDSRPSTVSADVWASWRADIVEASYTGETDGPEYMQGYEPSDGE